MQTFPRKGHGSDGRSDLFPEARLYSVPPAYGQGKAGVSADAGRPARRSFDLIET